MSMSHEACTHPRTPAGRSACRKAHAGLVAPGTDIAGEPRTRGNSRSNKPAINISTATEPKQPRKRSLKANHDLADVPHVFSATVREAWKAGWDVKTGSPYNAAERVITITSEYGQASLVWKCNLPHGVTAAMFRPTNTSITSRGTVNEIIRKLEGWE